MSGPDLSNGRGAYANSWMDTSRQAFPMGGSLSLEESVAYLMSAAARPPPAPSPPRHHSPPARASESIYYAPPPPQPVMAAGTHKVPHLSGATVMEQEEGSRREFPD